MTETEKGRPVTSGTAHETVGETIPSVPDPADNTSAFAGLRRRSVAAQRMPRLDCGHADPLRCYWEGHVVDDDQGELGDAYAGDYWHDMGFDLGVRERELAGAGRWSA